MKQRVFTIEHTSSNYISNFRSVYVYIRTLMISANWIMTQTNELNKMLEKAKLLNNI